MVDIPLALIALVLSIQFIAAFVRSTFGFGDALVAMPLLTLVIGIKSATPLVALVAFTTAITIILESWRSADFRAAIRLIAGAMLGIPLGLWGLKNVPEGIVKGILGGVLISFALYNLLRPQLPRLKHPAWAYLFGFSAGMLGGAYNTNGPPAVIYGTLERWPPAQFRATLQGFLLSGNVLIVSAHGLSGLWTATVLKLYILAVPVVLLAIFLGSKVNRRFSAERFSKFLYGILIVLGMIMLY